MTRGRGWLLVLGVVTAVACSLPSADEFAHGQTEPVDDPVEASALVDGAFAVETGTPPATTGVSLSIDPPVVDRGDAIELGGDGMLDWAYWSPALIRCAACTTRIGAASSTEMLKTYGDDARSFVWTGGAPTASGTSHGGIYIEEIASTIELPVQLPDTGVVLVVHVGIFNAAGRFDVGIDGVDAGVAPSVSVPSGTNGYRVVIHAKAPGDVLRLSWTLTGRATAVDANVTLSTVTLSPE